MENRNTRQKDIIIDTLKHSKDHPTISELYKKVKSADNSIGQATVYRTVSMLYNTYKLKKIPIKGIDHYDMNDIDHYHLYCKKCHKIIDLFDDNYFDLMKKMEKQYNIKLDQQDILFKGICNECLKNNDYE